MPDSITSVLLLTDFARRLLGISPEVARTIDRAQFHLGGGWTLRAAALVVAVAAVWFGWCYLRDGKRPSLWVKVPLLLLRLVALCALMAMLLQPMLRLGHSDRIRSSVAVLVDDSLSMGFTDPRLSRARQERESAGAGGSVDGLTRAQVIARIADQPRVNLLAALARRYNVRLYRFSGDARPVPLPKDAAQRKAIALQVTPDSRRGNSTRMGDALRRALDDTAGQPVSGALVLSDGGSNLGDDPATMAERARNQGMLVSTLGVGDPTPTRDVGLTEVLADQVVRKENVVQVFAGVSHRGFEGRSVSVTLRRGGEVVGTRSLTLGASSHKQTVAFTYVAKQPGTFAYTVSVSRLPGEVTGANNERRYLQRVVTKRLRILYVEAEPRWEYRYLRNAILRDQQIEFACLLLSAQGQGAGEGNVPISAFPADEAALFDYDIIILGDIPRGYFGPLQLQNLRRFVQDKGGSLIVIAGEKHVPAEYRGTPLEGVLPVVVPAEPEQVITDEPFQWELTPEGRQDPLLRMADDSAESARVWQGLPGMYWCAGVPRAKPGATVLAVNSTRSNSYGKRILLAVQAYGAGRCLICLTDSTWRWRWRVGDRYFYRFWGQAIRSMTPHEPAGGNRFAQVNADRSEYLLGDRVSIHARLLDSFYRPIKAGQVTGTLTADTGLAVPLVLNGVPGSPGLYAGDFMADRIGRFQVAVASPANPTAKATASLLVQSVALEHQQPEMNETLLRRVAAAGGGRYYQPDELRRWLESLKANDQVIRSESEVELWDAPLLLLFFIVPLALEWLIRKRSGML